MKVIGVRFFVFLSCMSFISISNAQIPITYIHIGTWVNTKNNDTISITAWTDSSFVNLNDGDFIIRNAVVSGKYNGKRKVLFYTKSGREGKLIIKYDCENFKITYPNDCKNARFKFKGRNIKYSGYFRRIGNHT